MDVLLSAGKIERMGAGLSAPEGAEVIEAEGRILLPGLIDDQVHFREPGLTDKACIHTESRAAVAGGITSYMEMPNTSPPTLDAARLQEKRAIAERDSLANYAFYLGASPDNINEIRMMDVTAVAGIKVFMGSSTGNLLVNHEEDLRRIFAAAPTLVALHSEDDSLIAQNLKRISEDANGELDVSMHPKIRSREACLASTQRAIRLANETGARIHVLHITTREETELFETGPVTGKRITAEACVHHLFFDDRDYGRMGNLIKCNPAIKEEEDRKQILAAVKDGRIDVIATDHAPHTLNEKRKPYSEAPSGLPLVQHSLQMLLHLAKHGPLTLETIVQRAAHAPAELFGIRDRGHIREGYWADLVLVDPQRKSTVTRDSLFYRCGWSPLEDFKFESSIDTVWVNGRKTYDEGAVIEGAPGMALEFDRKPV